MEKEEKQVYRILQTIQQELKAPKDKYNPYGSFKYRSAESIYENLKPLLKKHNCTLMFSEEPMAVGESVYLKCTARLTCNRDSSYIESTSAVRDGDDRKGLSWAQGTGCCLSYLRKYVMCGMFLIDDGVDDDSISGKPTGKDEDKVIRTKIKECSTVKELNALWNSIDADMQEAYTPLFSIRKNQILGRSKKAN